MYPVRYKVVKFVTTNEKTQKKLVKLLQKQSKTEYTPEEIADKLNSKEKDAVKIEYQDIVAEGKNTEADKAIKEANGKFPYILKDGNNVIFIQEKLEPSPKPFSEVKGLVVSDYQNYLEKLWLKDLHKKHKVEIKKDVLNEIKHELNNN
jgi:peptidyl-prolyl cis-trans isomerase SurA